MTSKVITRIAPSPTGLLHVGTARTALFNYLFARKHGGTFLLRIEDTDRERSRPEYEHNILEGLAWLGLWEAGAPPSMRQSERTARYRELLEKLVHEGKAYLSKEESKREPGKEVEVVRLRNPGGAVTFEDLIRGAVTMEVDSLGDMVIARSLEEPLYHFAVVVDDADMGVTHVIRGEDHISNTPRQILIQEALRFPRPQYAHLPLLLAPDRSKLSKRYGAVSIGEYRRMGYLPEALVNYLALLGWNPGTEQELFGVRQTPQGERTDLSSVLEDLARAFSLEGVQKGGAIFTLEKLNWFNAQHLRRKSPEFLLAYIQAALEGYPQARQLVNILERSPAALEDFVGRVSVAHDIARQVGEGEWRFYEMPPLQFPEFAETPEAFADLLAQVTTGTKEDAQPRATRALLATLLAEVREALEKSAVAWNAADLEAWLRNEVVPALQQKYHLPKSGAIFWPVRVALAGKARSPSPFVLLEALGKAEALERLAAAREVLLRHEGAHA